MKPTPHHRSLARALAALVCVVAIGLGGCRVLGGRASLDEHRTGTITSPQMLGIRNFTVLEVDPAGQSVQVDWRGYNTLSGDAFNLPYEDLRLTSDSETHLVTSKGAGNGALIVDGKKMKFASGEQRLLIRFGTGTSIEMGSDYGAAVRVYVDEVPWLTDVKP